MKTQKHQILATLIESRWARSGLTPAIVSLRHLAALSQEEQVLWAYPEIQKLREPGA